MCLYCKLEIKYFLSLSSKHINQKDILNLFFKTTTFSLFELIRVYDIEFFVQFHHFKMLDSASKSVVWPSLLFHGSCDGLV